MMKNMTMKELEKTAKVCVHQSRRVRLLLIFSRAEC